MIDCIPLVYLITLIAISPMQNAEWDARFRAEYSAASAVQTKATKDVTCTTSMKDRSKSVDDEMSVKGESRQLVRVDSESPLKRVHVWTPEYGFRLHWNPTGHSYELNSLSEARSNPDHLVRTKFTVESVVDTIVHAGQKVIDVPILKMSELVPWRYVTSESDQGLGELPTFEFDFSKDQSNFQRVTATFIPSQDWRLRSWRVEFKGDGAVSTKTIEYKQWRGGVIFPSAIRLESLSPRPDGSLQSNRLRQIEVLKLSTEPVDEHLFTLSHYGLPDLLAPREPQRKGLGAWFWGSLIVAIGMLVYLWATRTR